MMIMADKTKRIKQRGVEVCTLTSELGGGWYYYYYYYYYHHHHHPYYHNYFSHHVLLSYLIYHCMLLMG